MNRPTLILEEPILKSLRRAGFFQAFQTPEEIERRLAFVDRWAEGLAEGWVNRFFGDLPAEERKKLKEHVKRKLLAGL